MEGESSLPEVDAECVMNREQLLRLPEELQAMARQAKHDPADESAGGDERSDLREKRGRPRRRSGQSFAGCWPQMYGAQTYPGRYGTAEINARAPAPL